MATPRVTLAVGPSAGSGPVQQVTEFSGGSVKDNASSGPEVRFTMPARSAAARVVDGLATDVWVYVTGALGYRCRVLPVDQSWDESGEGPVDVVAVGYKRVVEARHLIDGPPTFLGVDEGAILWALIGHTQGQVGGSLGITAGTYLTGTPRDRTEYQIGDNLGTIMGQLTGVDDGPWWGVDANRVFTARKWSSFPVRTHPILWGTNARTLRRARGQGFANAAGAVGSREQTVPKWVEAPDVATDPRGRWETFDASHSTTVLQSTVDDHARGALEARAYPPNVWTVTLDPADFFEGSSRYRAGDHVTIVVPRSAVDERGVPSLTVAAQVTEVSIGFDDAGGTSVSLAAVETAA
jgi:hypothetical protein